MNSSTSLVVRRVGIRTDPALDEIDVSDLELWTTDTHWGYFERLRNEDPNHYCAEGVRPYWSVTRFEDIVRVEKSPEIYSSEPGIVILTPPRVRACRARASSRWTARATMPIARSCSRSRPHAT
ncbi:MAG: hypothetical protein R3E53_16410 [Myxococcota bacterium]